MSSYFRDAILGAKLSHACVMRRCHDLLGDGRIHQFCIRSGDKSEFTFAKEHTDMHRFSFDSLTSLIRDLQESNTPVYFTIDLDCLDPSVFPGTGTPEAGGVSYKELLDAILQASNANIIGADIGIRNYTEKDLKWVELAVEMKSLELPVETMIEYVSLGFHSDNVSEARTLILQKHRKTLIERRKQINNTLRRLEQKLTENNIE